VLKLLALGKYYFWESHNIFDFALIIGSNMGILMTIAFPDFSIGPLATLLRAFRIGRILRLLKQKKSLKMLIDTIFYIFPILINIVFYMFIITMMYSIIGIQLFSKVMFQVELNENCNFQSLGGALLLLFRITTGERWNILMREFALDGAFNGVPCKP
jgi:Ion transport protein